LNWLFSRKNNLDHTHSSRRKQRRKNIHQSKQKKTARTELKIYFYLPCYLVLKVIKSVEQSYCAFCQRIAAVVFCPLDDILIFETNLG
jgi:molybdenum cofactor biosynthesis enzyme MoaA